MIKTLQIKNFLLIPDVEIEFLEGLTVVTGETGAGKSLIVDSIELALGARSDSGVVRSGCDKAEIFVIFDVQHQAVKAWLDEHDLDDGQECIVHRIIFRSRPSRAYINGRPVSMQSIREMTSGLVEIHGQHEHQRLLSPANHCDILDSFAGISKQRRQLTELSKQIRQQEKLRTTMDERSDQIESELEILRHQSASLDELNPEPGEFSRLKDDLTRMTHSEELSNSLHDISNLLLYHDEINVSNSLNESISGIEKLTHFDPSLQPFVDMLEEARVRVDDVAREIYSISSRSDSDPVEIESTDERMASLQRQARLHNVNADDLPGVVDSLSEMISTLERELENVHSIDTQIDTLKNEYRTVADELSKARRQSATEFSAAISEQIQNLGMEGGVFMAELTESKSGTFTSYGNENINFLVSTNPGQPIGALSKVASGGELSRLSLAIQVVAANITEVSTLIFDEIDIGIGGQVADRVGNMLRSLGQSRQIFCITHLPQVAARGDHQFKVEKKTDDLTNVEITTLDKKQRISEIARMLGGAKITLRTTEHAKELLSQSLT